MRVQIFICQTNLIIPGIDEIFFINFIKSKVSGIVLPVGDQVRPGPGTSGDPAAGRRRSESGTLFKLRVPEAEPSGK